MHVFEQCSAGDYSLAQDLSKPVQLTPLEASQRDQSDKRWTLQHEAGRAPDAPRRQAEAIAEDDIAAMMGGMQTGGRGGGGEGPAPIEEEPEEPLEDGWERVPTRKGGRRGGGGRGRAAAAAMPGGNAASGGGEDVMMD